MPLVVDCALLARASFSATTTLKTSAATKDIADNFIVDLTSSGACLAPIFESVAVEQRPDGRMPDFPNSTAPRDEVLDLIRNCLIRDTRGLAAEPRIHDSSNAKE